MPKLRPIVTLVAAAWLTLALPSAAAPAAPPRPEVDGPTFPWSEDAGTMARPMALPDPGRGRADAGRALLEHWIVTLDGPDVWERSLAAKPSPSAARIAPPSQPVAAAAAPTVALRADLDRLFTEVSRAQLGPIADIEARGGRVLSRYRVVDNALLVLASPAQARAIAALPEVVDLQRALLARPHLDRVREHVGAVAVAQELGYDGQGSVIAVIDTGIDYTHAAFGGAGTRQAYAANEPSQVEPGSFPTSKVVGGVDLAGSRYAADCPLFPPPALQCSFRPSPDADPLDEVHPEGMPGQGHGSHTASIAAGTGVVKIEGRGISPGIAPGASLVAVKIFGAPRSSDLSYVVGETALLLDGLEWILSHNLGMRVPGSPAEDQDGERRLIDVASLSLGSSWGAGMASLEQAVSRLSETGTSLVASAGNDGNTPFIVSAPAIAAEALAVAASHAPGETRPLLSASWGPRELEEPAVESVAGLTARLADTGAISAPMAWYGQACDQADGSPSPPVQPVANKVALIARGECLFIDKLDNAAQLGAVAAVVYTNEAPVRAMEGICGQVGGSCFDIPAVMIEREVGLDLRIAALGPDPVTATLSLAPIADIEDRIYAGSSRGPARRTSALKPQLTAPGSAVMAAWAGTGDGRRQISGTSQAAPSAAGALAILVQRSRDEALTLGPLDRAAMLINQARPVIHAGQPELGPLVPVGRQGAGLLDLRAAAKTEILLRSAEGIAELGFGTQHASSGALYEQRRIELRNLGQVQRELKLGARFLFEDDQNAGLGLQFDPARLSLAAGASAWVSVTLSVDPNALRSWTLTGPGRARLLANPDFDRFEIDGFVEAVEVDAAGEPIAGGQQATMPFQGLPHRHSCIEASAGALRLPPGGEAGLSLRNDCVEPGGAAVYSIAAEDPAELSIPASLDIRHVGLRHFLLPPSARDPRYPDLRLQVIELAIETRGPRHTPLDARFRVYFDTDRDGTWDRVGQVETFEGPRFGSFVSDVDPGSLMPDWVALPRNPDTGGIQFFISELPYDLDERVSVLRFFANHPDYGIGVDLGQGDARFDFAIEAADALGDVKISEDFPGFDHAPDDLERGGRFGFEQPALDCLSLACPECSRPSDGSAGELLELNPLGGQVNLSLAACADAGIRPPQALLVNLATDLAEGAALVIPIETGWPPLLLPLLLRDAAP